MKKRLKIVLIIVAILIVLSLIFFLVDLSKTKKGEKPIFCIEIGRVLDGGTIEYCGLGYKIIYFNTISGYKEIKLGSWAMQYEDFEKEIDEFENKIIIKSALLGENEPKEYMEIVGTEAQEIERIFSNLKFTTETCDGINDYTITLRKYGISYGIEIYTECHITAEGQEAILNANDSYKLIEIINRHKKNVINSNEEKLEEIEFVRTYNVKTDLKEIDETGQYNFYVVDQYQMNELTLIKVDKKYKLEEKSNYEFTFKGVKGDNEDYSIEEIFTNFEITDIRKTYKKGMNQRQDAMKNYTKMIRVDGKLYYDTGKLCKEWHTCGTLDGLITSIVDADTIPTKDGQANFTGCEGYQYCNGIEVPMSDGWHIFEIKSVDKFGFVFYQKTMITPNQKETIISKGEIKGVDYNVYAFEGHVAINLNSDSTELTKDSLPLRDALLQNKITMDEIIEKANQDIPDATILKDGGSKEYHYDNYTIIKVHKINGNRDVYIGPADLNINDLEI